MSADNGVYIGVFADGMSNAGKEYRVIYATAIDNLTYKSTTDDGFNNDEVVNYFDRAKIFSTERTAQEYASILAETQLCDPICPVLEYGISTIRFTHPFEWYIDSLLNRG